MASSPQDCRNYGGFPNKSRFVQGSQIFDIVATDSRVSVPVDSRVSAFFPGDTFQLSAAALAVAGNTTYTGVFNQPLVANAPVNIQGFQNAVNNGLFAVVSCTATQLVVNNAAGVAETHAATVQYDDRAAGFIPQNSRV